VDPDAERDRPHGRHRLRDDPKPGSVLRPGQGRTGACARTQLSGRSPARSRRGPPPSRTALGALAPRPAALGRIPSLADRLQADLPLWVDLLDLDGEPVPHV